MLAIHLALNNQQVTVAVNGAESHTFPFEKLAITKRDVEAFFVSPVAHGQRLYRAVFAEKTEARVPSRAEINANIEGVLRLILHELESPK